MTGAILIGNLPDKSVDDLVEQADAMRKRATSFILQEAYFITHSTFIRRGSPKMRIALAKRWRPVGNLAAWAFVESFEVLRTKGMV